MENTVALDSSFFRVLQFPLLIIIPPMYILTIHYCPTKMYDSPDEAADYCTLSLRYF
jgi:hypothetical protein